MLLIVFALLITAAVAWALARPLLAAVEAPADAAAFNTAVYRDQLEEVERDVARGVLGAPEAAAARTEIERRILAAAKGAPAPEAAAAVARAPKNAAVLVAAAVAAAAGGLYLALGDPAAPDQPLRARAPGGPVVAGGDAMHGQMDDLVRQLDAKLKENPDDPTGWALMARSLARLDRPADAIAAYERAITLTEGRDGALMAEYAEMRVIANGGVVDRDAEAIFARMLREQPGAPQGRYYLALAKAQRGDRAGALADWRALLADTPPDAPWRASLEQQIADASGAPAPRGPDADAVKAAEAMSPAERGAMIDAMVNQLAERLKTNPDDLAGWRRLARAYDVQGRAADSARAHERVLALAPNDPEALWALGLFAQAQGDAAGARRRWQTLERTLPADAPERTQVRAALESLKK
ncbi:MAG: c-type cytochrome biogenesis protein CcmI [Hyphomonadaceae bacterium]|nr:c-type cytochrome biogenesis protein CcmI [Hyphomonadaceae bacterium]